MLWANLHLLFWLSLIPFVTAWMGENRFATIPVAFYGVALLMPAIAYYILVKVLIRAHPENHSLADAIGKDIKGRISPLIYCAAIPLAFIHPLISMVCYIIVALMWLVPDKRIERLEKRK